MPRMRSKLDRPSRIAMAARRQRRLVRPALLAVPLLGLGAVGMLAVRGAVEQAGTGSWIRRELGLALPVRHIVVEGQHLTSEGEITAALAVPIGTPIMRFSPAEAETRVEQLPFIETATVSRRLPGTIVVAVTERKPYAVWQNDGRFVLIDRTGKVVEDQGLNGKDAEAFARLPLVVGPGAPAGAGALVDMLDGQPAIRAQVVAAVRVGERRWNLDLKNGCQVLLPEAEEAPALTRLASLEQRFRLFERPLAVIDMRLPDRLVLRPDPLPAPTDDSDGAAAGAAKPDAGKAGGTQAGAKKDASRPTGDAAIGDGARRPT